MEIPAPVHLALKQALLTAADWHRIRQAFSSVPESGAVAGEDIRQILAAAECLRDAERLLLARSVPFNLEMPWEALREQLFRTLWELWGPEGTQRFCERVKLPRTTVYRWLHDLGIHPSQIRHARPILRDLSTVAGIRAEIERLQKKLADLESQNRSTVLAPEPAA